jgi:hypothetical protein
MPASSGPQVATCEERLKPAAEKSERSKVKAPSASSARMSAKDVQSVNKKVWSS